MTDLETLMTLLRKFDMDYIKSWEDDKIKVIITKHIILYFDSQGNFIEWVSY